MSAPFVSAGSDAWFKSGLGKSAFTSRIYRGLPLDYYLPGINDTHELAIISGRKRYFMTIVPKFYQAHDAYMMFYQPAGEAASSTKRKPRRKTAWWSLIRKTVTSQSYLELNKVTRGSQELAALAGAQFLASLFNQLYKAMRNVKTPRELTTTLDMMTGDQLAQALGGEEKLGQAAGKAVETAREEAMEYLEARREAGDAAEALAGAGGHGYVSDALSALRFLEEPEEFRKRVRILKWAAIVMRQVIHVVPSSMRQAQVASEYGGITGVTRMLRESQLRDIRPEELAALALPGELSAIARAYTTARIIQKQVMVAERAASARPVVFVDKSGSMDASFGYEVSVPKISVAAGFALALYRRLGGIVYLFDTEPARVKPSDIVRALLTVRAEGGTDIDEVMREILRIGRREYTYIVVTDGVSEVEEDTIRQMRARGLADRTRFILVPPAEERSWLRRNFKYHYVDSLAEFLDASRKILG